VLQRSYRSTTKVAGYILQAVVWILGRRRGSLFSVERGQRKVLERETYFLIICVDALILKISFSEISFHAKLNEKSKGYDFFYYIKKIKRC
jgi:hypothetical protein